MIRITDHTLIIEVKCNERYQPLQLLGDLQQGLINLLHIMSYAVPDAPKEVMSNAVQQTTILLKEMMVSNDQFGEINELMTVKEKHEFNNL